VTDKFQDVHESADPNALTAAILRLSAVRSWALVGLKFAHHYPDEASWQEALTSPAFLETIEEFAAAIQQIRYAIQVGPVADPVAAARVVQGHYDRAVGTLSAFAVLHDLAPEDLLNCLTSDVL
jgi:hypothetical protein